MAEAAGTRPFGLFERILAVRYLRAKRAHGGVALISVISFIGIMLAVAVLIITMSVMNGFRETLLSRILGVNGHVYVQTADGPPDLLGPLAVELRATPGVTLVTPIVQDQALASANGQVSGVYVRGVEPADLADLPLIAGNIRTGDLDDFAVDAEGVARIALGLDLARRLDAPVGSVVTLTAPHGAQTPFGIAPRRKSYEVAAIFSVGMAEYDSAFLYMPLSEAQLFFNRGASVDQLEIRVEDPDRTQDVINRVRAVTPPTLYVSDWRTQNASLVGALVVERNVMRLILMMIVAIAAMNIISGLVMLVKNKSRDIAILRTMGATQGSILRVFFMAGAAVGVLGAAAGLALGVVFCTFIGPIQNFVSWVIGRPVFPGDVYSLNQLPARIEWPEVALVAGWALLMSFLATLPPAWRASRLDPVEALRYE